VFHIIIVFVAEVWKIKCYFQDLIWYVICNDGVYQVSDFNLVCDLYYDNFHSWDMKNYFFKKIALIAV